MSYVNVALGPFAFRAKKRPGKKVRVQDLRPTPAPQLTQAQKVADPDYQLSYEEKLAASQRRNQDRRRAHVLEEAAKSTLKYQEGGPSRTAKPGELASDPADIQKEFKAEQLRPRLGDNATDLRRYARRMAVKYGLNPDLYEAQIQQESGFDPNSTSSAGAQGIAQIMPGTARSWGVDPMDSKAALKVAAKQMANYYKQYGGKVGPKQGLNTDAYKDALIAYNAGPGRVGNSKLPGETTAYIDRIFNMAKKGGNYAGEGSSTKPLNALKTGEHLAKKFGLRLTSGYRTPEHNAEVGGVSGSYHTQGSKKNPMAVDLVGSSSEMKKAAAAAERLGYSTLIHDAGSGTHLHIQNDGGSSGAAPSSPTLPTDGLSGTSIPDEPITNSSSTEPVDEPNLFEWFYNMNMGQGMDEDSPIQQQNLFLAALINRRRKQ